MLEPRSKGAAKPASDNKIGTGRGTLRLRSKGPATVEDEVRFSRESVEENRTWLICTFRMRVNRGLIHCQNSVKYYMKLLLFNVIIL